MMQRNWSVSLMGVICMVLAIMLIMTPIAELRAQTPTAGRNAFAGSATVRANHATAASGTVAVTCGGITCPAGVYEVHFQAEVVHANTTQTSPNLSAVFGFAGETGALTATATQPNGATTVTIATTGGTFYAVAVVHTSGALSIAVALSGSLGAQLFNWEYSATRLR